MARLKDREKALELRKKHEMSYSQIKKILGISKSTLSYWLRDYPLSEKKIKELQRQGWKKSEAGRERFRNTMKRKREERLEKIYNIQKRLILPLSDRELFLAGLLLYWGEGRKCQQDRLSISNNNPSVIKFFIHWLNKSLSVPRKKIRIQLHLYNDMDVNEETKYWSKILKVPLSQFARPYIKKSSSKRIDHKGGFGHGTCNAEINSVPLAEKVFMSIKAISNKYQ